MSSEIIHSKKKELELEDVFAIIGVLALAGIFIWYQTGVGTQTQKQTNLTDAAATAPSTATAYTPGSTENFSGQGDYTHISRPDANSHINNTPPPREAPKNRDNAMHEGTGVASSGTTVSQPSPKPLETPEVKQVNIGQAPAGAEAALRITAVEQITTSQLANAEPAIAPQPVVTSAEAPAVPEAASVPDVTVPAKSPFAIERNLQTNLIDFTGTGKAADQLRLKINDQESEIIIADQNGLWKSSEQLEPGIYRFQLLTLDSDGKVAQSTETFVYEILPTNESSANRDDLVKKSESR